MLQNLKLKHGSAKLNTLTYLLHLLVQAADRSLRSPKYRPCFFVGDSDTTIAIHVLETYQHKQHTSYWWKNYRAHTPPPPTNLCPC